MKYWKGKNAATPNKFTAALFDPRDNIGAKKIKEMQASRNTDTNQDPIAAKIDEKVEEKVDEVVNQKTGEGLV